MPIDEKIRAVAEGWTDSRGKRLYLKQLRGGRLTRGETVIAKCAECCGGYVDGRRDCGVTLCPLYPWMPYRSAV